MSFVIEDGSGLPNANSYLSVAAADTYHVDYSGSTDWSGADNTAKERALRLATQYLDVRFNNRWKGVRVSQSQALAWPRSNVTNSDGCYLSSNEIPAAIKEATAESALRIILGDDLLGVIAAPGLIASETKKIGPLEKSVTYVSGKSQVKRYPLVDGLLKQLIDSDSKMERA